MPGCKAGLRFAWKRYLLCNSFRLDFPRVVTFNRTFNPGFLLPAALAGALRLVAFAAFVVRTHQEAARFQVLLQEIWAATLGTGLSHRPVGRGEPALRIVGATVKEVAAARLLLRQLARPTLGTLHPDVVLLHPLAFRIAAARNKLSIAAMPQQKVASALGALFIERDVWDLLRLVEPARGFAIGISGASHELPKAPAFQYHRPAAIFAVFLLRGFLHIGRVKVGQVDRVFLGERATVGIGLVVRAARIKRPVLAPLDDQRRAAPLALLVGGLLHPLHV